MRTLEALKRGCVELVSPEELSRKLGLKRALRVKLGVDPTSADLHLGHTVVLSRLRAFQDAGHTAVLILGDFTALIGDPSGRDATRPPLTEAEIEANAKTYQAQAFKVLDRKRTELRRNSEWLKSFVREGGLFKALQRYTVGQLLQREDFQSRMKAASPITLLEILYPIFQGYDSVAIKADVELGGNDQLFNLLMGRQMQKDAGQESQVAMTVPLLVGLDGRKKMSKSYGNAIALNEPPRELFGKVMRLSDELMWSYYELLTHKDMAEVKGMHPMEAKKVLAQELTERFHGAHVAEAERVFFESTFSQKKAPEDVATFSLSLPDGGKPMTWSEILLKMGAVKSRKEAQRLIAQGAVEADEKRVLKDEVVALSDFTLKVGKHKFYKVNLGGA